MLATVDKDAREKRLKYFVFDWTYLGLTRKLRGRTISHHGDDTSAACARVLHAFYLPLYLTISLTFPRCWAPPP